MSIRIHPASSFIFLECNLPRNVGDAAAGFYVQGKKYPPPIASPHLPAPGSLFPSALLVSLLWMSGLSVSQPDVISVSDTRKQAGSKESGRGCAAMYRSHRQKSPTCLLWGSLMTEQLINHPGFFSFIQLVCFSTPGQIPKVWIYSVRSKSGAPITDKTEFVIQQIPGYEGDHHHTLEGQHSLFRVSTRCTLSR